MSSEHSLTQRLEALTRALDDAVRSSESTPVTAANAEALKQQIIALYRESDDAIAAAQRSKDAAKALAERWKQLKLAPSPATTAPATAPATPLRVDYLGASTFVEKGWNLLSLGKPAESVEALRKALALAPGQGEALTLLAWALITAGQVEAAHDPLEQARTIDPNDPLALMVWGRWLALQGHFTDADGCLERVLDAGDGRASLYAHLYRAQLQRTLGAYDAAALTLRQALQRGPNLVQAWYELGRTHWECGRRADALAAWKSGSEANKFSPWGKHCAALLASLESGQEPTFVDS